MSLTQSKSSNLNDVLMPCKYFIVSIGCGRSLEPDLWKKQGCLGQMQIRVLENLHLLATAIITLVFLQVIILLQYSFYFQVSQYLNIKFFCFMINQTYFSLNGTFSFSSFTESLLLRFFFSMPNRQRIPKSTNRILMNVPGRELESIFEDVLHHIFMLCASVCNSLQLSFEVGCHGCALFRIDLHHRNTLKFN